MRTSFAVLLVALLACTHGQRRPANGERLDSPDQAAKYFATQRGITPDFDLNARYAAARDRIARMPQTSMGGDRAGAASLSTTLPGSWHFLGPGNIGGRTRALLIDPADSNVMYAGAVSGGVWKTTSGGASWAAITDWLPNLAVNALAFDTADSRVIYAGTGEGYFREDVRGTALPIRGNGIFVTRNSGSTWEQLPSTTGEDFYWVNDIVVSAHDSRRIYAATRNGVFRSRDAGGSWTRVVTTSAKGGCLDLALRPDTAGDTLFAACGTLAQATVYRSANAENDTPWAAVLSEPGMGRTTLAVAPSHPSTIYALAARNEGVFDQGLFAVFRSTEGGEAGTWTAQVRTEDAPKSFGPLLLTNVITAVNEFCDSFVTTNISNMGWHCNVIAVDPKDENRVWAAGVDLFRSDDGGRRWGVASYWWTSAYMPSYVHPDQHAIVFDPHYDGAANQTMLVTNDGGVYRTDNARAAVATQIADSCTPDRSQVVFRSLNRDYGATQFYHGAVFPDGTRYVGGAQDNSSPMGGDDDGVNGWKSLFAGDGGFVAVDQVAPNIIYAEAQNAQVGRSDDGGQSFRFFFPPDGEYLFIAPFLLDPNNHDRLWLGGGRQLLRSDNHLRYSAATAKLDAPISALAVAPGRSDRMLLGSTSGAIHRNDAALSASKDTVWPSTKPRDGWVSSITFHPVDPNVAYATYAGFGGTHVWKTIDSGANWTPLDGSGDAALPDVPAHTVVIDAARLYLGTDLGIFVSTDDGAHWAAESAFPRVITECLVLTHTARGSALIAFTHGRGAWRLDLATSPRRHAVGR